MKPLSLALSIEWDDCTVALAGAGIDHGTESTAIELSARTLLDASGGPQASRDALALVQQALRQAGRRLDDVERFYVNVGPVPSPRCALRWGSCRAWRCRATAPWVPSALCRPWRPRCRTGASRWPPRMRTTVRHPIARRRRLLRGWLKAFLGRTTTPAQTRCPGCSVPRWMRGWASAITPPFCAVPAIGPSPRCHPRSARPMTPPWPSRRCAGS
ncbi:hypothetical protein V8H18_10490 [Lautropia mirabilis]